MTLDAQIHAAEQSVEYAKRRMDTQMLNRAIRDLRALRHERMRRDLARAARGVGQLAATLVMFAIGAACLCVATMLDAGPADAAERAPNKLDGMSYEVFAIGAIFVIVMFMIGLTLKAMAERRMDRDQ